MIRAGTARRIDLTGQQFGRLTVLHEDGQTTKNEIRWACRCECGGSKTVRAGHLKHGTVTSCGCYRSESVAARMKTHGRSKTTAHRTWRNMRDRCQNSRSRLWKDYGGRGITVCPEWDSFEQFYADMGDPPDGTSLDRIDNDGNYEPVNCRWTTSVIQTGNRRNSITIEFEGRRQTLKAWAGEIGISWTALRDRHRRGVVPPALFRDVGAKL